MKVCLELIAVVAFRRTLCATVPCTLDLVGSAKSVRGSLLTPRS